MPYGLILVLTCCETVKNPHTRSKVSLARSFFEEKILSSGFVISSVKFCMAIDNPFSGSPSFLSLRLNTLWSLLEESYINVAYPKI